MLGLPLAFLAHDLGEVRGSRELDDDLVELASRVPGVRRVAPSVRTSPRQLAVAVGALTTLLTAVSVRAVARPPRTRATGDYAAVTAVVGGHLASHVAQSLILRRPAPGLRGGLAVTVPYSALVLTRLHRRGYLPQGALGRDLVRAGAALPPLLIAVRLLGRRLG